jgi:diguanylate cyclase (GGDEF)-like protein
VAANVAERLRQVVADTPFCVGEGLEIPVTISIGVASRHGDGDAPDILLARADEALYEAKRQGRNRVELEPGASARSGRVANG